MFTSNASSGPTIIDDLNFLFMLVPELFDVAFDYFFDFDGIYFATLGVTDLIWKHLTEISSRYKKNDVETDRWYLGNTLPHNFFVVTLGNTFAGVVRFEC